MITLPRLRWAIAQTTWADHTHVRHVAAHLQREGYLPKLPDRQRGRPRKEDQVCVGPFEAAVLLAALMTSDQPCRAPAGIRILESCRSNQTEDRLLYHLAKLVERPPADLAAIAFDLDRDQVSFEVHRAEQGTTFFYSDDPGAARQLVSGIPVFSVSVSGAVLHKIAEHLAEGSKGAPEARYESEPLPPATILQPVRAASSLTPTPSPIERHH